MGRPAEITLTVAALRLGVSWERAWRLLLSGRLTGRREGRSWIVDAASVERLRAAPKPPSDANANQLPRTALRRKTDGHDVNGDPL